MEATPGIEPGYTDLQSAASPLRHVATGLDIWRYFFTVTKPRAGQLAAIGPVLPALFCWFRGEGAARATRELWSRDCVGPLATVLGLSGGRGPMRWAVKGGFGNCCGDPTVY